jgi:hypothetical protein
VNGSGSKLDLIKVSYTYGIATILVVGGLIFLFASRNDPAGGQSAAMVPLVAGFIGAAIQFVFGRETQTSTARQVERGIAAGAASQPTVTTSGDPPTTTVTPAEPPPPVTGSD